MGRKTHGWQDLKPIVYKATPCDVNTEDSYLMFQIQSTIYCKQRLTAPKNILISSVMATHQLCLFFVVVYCQSNCSSNSVCHKRQGDRHTERARKDPNLFKTLIWHHG